MKPNHLFILILTAFLFTSGCSYYNSFAPDWAKIGDSEKESS